MEKSPEKCYVFDTLDHQIHKQDCNLTAAVLCRVSCKKDAVRYGDLCFWSTGEAPSPYGFLGSSAACASAGYGMPYAHDEAENDFLRGKCVNVHEGVSVSVLDNKSNKTSRNRTLAKGKSKNIAVYTPQGGPLAD